MSKASGRYAVWCEDTMLRDGYGSGRAQMATALLRDSGHHAVVLSAAPPHPFAIHVMLELDLDIRHLEEVGEPEPRDLVIAIGEECPYPAQMVDVPDPMERFEDSYNDERVHHFREVRELLRQALVKID